jgi:hypothetical protein
LISAALSWPLNAGMPPPPFVTCFSAAASGGFSWSRFGPTLPVAPASFSVWQPPQPAEEKICLPFGAAVVAVGPVPVVVVAVAGAGFVAVTPQFGLPAHLATYAATSFASWPRKRFAGIGASG